jgi:hypothetical protein
MSPAKNLAGGGEGSKENFRGGGVMKFYSRFVKISRVGQNISKKCHFLAKFSHFWILGVKAKDFFRWEVKAKHTPHPSHTLESCMPLTANALRVFCCKFLFLNLLNNPVFLLLTVLYF